MRFLFGHKKSITLENRELLDQLVSSFRGDSSLLGIPPLEYNKNKNNVDQKFSNFFYRELLVPVRVTDRAVASNIITATT